jgi:phosphopantothenoylcysteine decarboxylase/phosphopantothenate--cysteine ligase
VVIAPAMDVDMWRHPATRHNVGALAGRGDILLEVTSGELASGLTGEGRMQEPEAILSEIRNILGEAGSLSGRRALVTAGPTHEPLDPVRFIGNHSSGKMGIALARELARAGAQVELVLGPVEAPPPMAGVTVHPVTTAAEMFERCVALAPDAEIVVMAAAVADYRPQAPLDHKMKKKEDSFSLALERTPDVLRELGRVKKPRQFLCGFALETDHEETHALGKLQEKNLDMIVLNSLNDPGAGFREDTNKVTIFTAAGRKMAFPLKSKTEVARDIVKVIAEAFRNQGR